MSIYLGNQLIAGVAEPARNIGEIVQSTIPLTDAGLHLLDGSLISGSGSYADFVTYIAGLVSTYPDLFETEANWQTSVTTYGVCGKFVYDSVNNTVRLPKITGIIEGTVDATALGDLVQAGLPNITGDVGYTTGVNEDATGAFTKDANTNSPWWQGATNVARTSVFHLDASRSSSIYGNSTTVQPQTIKAFIYIVIATSAKTDIQVDIDEIATDLNGKADTDLSNITTVNTPITTTATNPFVNKLTNADITVAPSSDINTGILFKDVNNNNLAGFGALRFANGVQATQMSAINKISGTEKSAYLNVFVDSNGNDYADASAGVKSKIANWAMPSGTAVNITLDASGNWGAATKNGFVYVGGTATGAGGLYLENTTNNMKTFSTAHASGYSVDCFIPVAKGQSIQATMVSGTIRVAKFIQVIGG